MKPDLILASPEFIAKMREFLWWNTTLYSPAGLKRLFPWLRG